jgi:hypothetical protein
VAVALPRAKRARAAFDRQGNEHFVREVAVRVIRLSQIPTPFDAPL